ncbi:MAG: phytoene desaturase [Burkholderiaceae bacterium]
MATSTYREVTAAGLMPLQHTTSGDQHGTPAIPRQAPHAVVIGSGFGGLAAAIRLSVKGYRVTILERLDGPGGRAYVHRKNGYVFDAGPTIVTAPQLFEELWQLCGRKLSDDVDLRLMDPFYRVRFDDGTHFNYNGSLEAMKAEVARISPSDLAGYEKFLAEAENCYKHGFIELGSVAFDSAGDLLTALPSMVKMRAWRTLYSMVCGYIKHPKLRVVLTLQSLLIGGNPFGVTCVYSLIASLERRFGVHWAIGGTGALIQGMLKLLQERGVQIRYNSTVRKIAIKPTAGKPRTMGVELENGDMIAADMVVSNADAAWTYQNLIEPAYRRVWTDKKLAKADYSMSLFVWYFGTRKQYADVPHHMMVLGPRYEGLLTDIFKRKVLAEDFSLYLHRPSATDPSMAPPGCDTFYVLSPVPHLDSGTDWNEIGERYRQAVAKRLNDTVLPGFEAHVEESFFITPQHFKDRLLSAKGAAFGFEPLLLQSAWFRPHNRSEDIAGLYMVGAGTHPGAGIPGVLSSAKALDSVVPAAHLYEV